MKVAQLCFVFGLFFTFATESYALSASCGSAKDTAFPDAPGDSTKLFQFPWMALIAYNTSKEIRYSCTGSIINKRYILTGATCVTQIRKPIYVRLGEYNQETEEDCEENICAPPTQDIPIEEIIAHPSYRQKTKYDADIALIRLKKDIDLSSDAVSPICLPIDPAYSVEDYEGKRFVVTGWNDFRVSVPRHPVLQKNIVLGLSHENCSNSFKKQTEITSNQMCAKSVYRHECIGVSGSPLVSYETVGDKTIAVQYGILSFGAARCDTGGFPSVYTKVTPFKDWILENVKP